MGIETVWTTGDAIAASVVIAGSIAWLVRQDRRIESLKAAVADLTKDLAKYQTREVCGERQRAVDGSMRDLPTKGAVAECFEQIRGLDRQAAEDRRKSEVAYQKIESKLDYLIDEFNREREERAKERAERERDARAALGRTPTDPNIPITR